MKFCDERIQKHLLNGGKVKRRLGSCNIIMYIGENGFIFDNSGSFYVFCEQDLTSDDWEIVELEYDWDKIIKDKVLCEFWDDEKDTDDPCVGLLAKRTTIGFYRINGCCLWKHCKPFNPNDFNIAKDLKEYEK